MSSPWAQQCPHTQASVLLWHRRLMATGTVNSTPVFCEAASVTPLGVWGHHRALARPVGAELPEVRGSRAAKSRAKPGFPLPPGRRAFSSGSAQPAPETSRVPGRAVSHDKLCPGTSHVRGGSASSSHGLLVPGGCPQTLIPGAPRAPFGMALWGHC